LNEATVQLWMGVSLGGQPADLHVCAGEQPHPEMLCVARCRQRGAPP
jgi:hypothetical protein